MDAITLKEKLGNNACHIHKEYPALTIRENGNLNVKTCCLLFKSQLFLLVDEQEAKHLEDFPVV